ncbi:MAG: BACON domain-containing protein [Alistipes sp.]|nr:BACON domain-containing protein [Alistipes sp.]
MKNLFTFLAIATLLFTACELIETQNNSAQIKLISSERVNVGSGSAMGIIKYEILDLIIGAEVKATADVDWIGNFNLKEQGKIQYTIERNPDDEVREGTITITYDKSQLEITVVQALSEDPTNKDVDMPMLQGKYYGIQSGMYNYYLVFTDLGMDSNNLFYTPNARYYFVDLYLLTEPEDMNNIVVPIGEYEYDITNSGYANTFIESFSWYQINDESGVDISQTDYEKGKLTVEDGKITLDITLEINSIEENHKVVYVGDYSLIDCTNEVY